MYIEHVLLMHEPGGEAAARSFWVEAMGFHEVPKPAELKEAGGGWFRNGDAEVHIREDMAFTPAKDAHPAFVVDDLDAFAKRFEAIDQSPAWDSRIPGRRRFFAFDPAGNRLEFIAAKAAEEEKT